MKSFVVGLIVFAGIACAQDSSESSQQQKAPEAGAKESAKGSPVVCRLESVTWNPVRSEMTWLVSVWDRADSDRPMALERYAIHLDAAVMEFNGESRAFDPTEAKHVRVLMDMISTYSVQSTVWWDHGGGSEPDGQVIPVPNDKDGTGTKGKDDGKPESPKAPPKPAPAVLRGPVAFGAPAKQPETAGAVH